MKPAASNVALIPAGAVWKYNDNVIENENEYMKPATSNQQLTTGNLGPRPPAATSSA